MKIIDSKSLLNGYYLQFYNKSPTLFEICIAFVNFFMIFPLAKIFLYFLKFSNASINVKCEIVSLALFVAIFCLLYIECYSYIKNEKNKYSAQDRIIFICDMLKKNENLFLEKECIQFLINKFSEKADDIDEKYNKHMLHMFLDLFKFVIPLIVTIFLKNYDKDSVQDLNSMINLIMIFTVVTIISIAIIIFTLKVFESIKKSYSYEKSRTELKDNLSIILVNISIQENLELSKNEK